MVLDEQGVDGGYARRLRLTLAAEHLDRTVDDDSLLEVMADCVDPAGMFAAFAESAPASTPGTRAVRRGSVRRADCGGCGLPRSGPSSARSRWCPTSPCTTPTGVRAPSSGRVVSDARLATPVRRLVQVHR